MVLSWSLLDREDHVGARHQVRDADHARGLLRHHSIRRFRPADRCHQSCGFRAVVRTGRPRTVDAPAVPRARAAHPRRVRTHRSRDRFNAGSLGDVRMGPRAPVRLQPVAAYPSRLRRRCVSRSPLRQRPSGAGRRTRRGIDQAEPARPLSLRPFDQEAVFVAHSSRTIGPSRISKSENWLAASHSLTCSREEARRTGRRRKSSWLVSQSNTPPLMVPTYSLIASPEASWRRSTITAVPPTFNTRLISFSASAGLLKFWNAAWHTTKSKVPLSNGMAAASPWRKSTWTPSRAAFSRAMASSVSLISRPLTW